MKKSSSPFTNPFDTTNKISALLPKKIP